MGNAQAKEQMADAGQAWLVSLVIGGSLIVGAFILLVAGLFLMPFEQRPGDAALRQGGNAAAAFENCLRSKRPNLQRLLEVGDSHTLRGRALCEQLIRAGHLDPEPMLTVTDPGAGSGPKSRAALTEFVLKPDQFPLAVTELREILRQDEGERLLAVYNARHWNHAEEHGVLTIWVVYKGNASIVPSVSARWLTFEQASKEWAITEEEWNNPAEKLFGKKAPFEFTHE